MKTYTLTLTSEQLRALHEFLQRTPIKGAEVPLFTQIALAMNKAQEVNDQPDKNPVGV